MQRTTGRILLASISRYPAGVTQPTTKMNKPELKTRRGPRTPRSNDLEAARLAMKMPRTPAYDSALELCRDLEAKLQQAQSRIAELEQRSADTERLDFLDKDAGEQVYSVGTTWYARSACGRPHHKQKDLRAAIDAARGLPRNPTLNCSKLHPNCWKLLKPC